MPFTSRYGRETSHLTRSETCWSGHLLIAVPEQVDQRIRRLLAGTRVLSDSASAGALLRFTPKQAFSNILFALQILTYLKKPSNVTECILCKCSFRLAFSKN